MTSTRKLCFVDLYRDEDLFTKLAIRPHQIQESLPRPKEQSPRLIQFIGTRHKSSALRALFPNNNFKQPRTGFAHLVVDNTSIEHENPLLIIDTPLQPDVHCVSNLHDEKTTIVPWTLTDIAAAADYLHGRLFFLFVNVVCLFIDDFSAPDLLVSLINQWMKIGSNTLLPHQARPHLLIISQTTIDCTTTTKLYALGQATRFHETFSELSICILSHESLSNSARYRNLKESIVNATFTVSAARQESCLSFTALHLQVLFEKAALHCALENAIPFNHIASTRDTDTRYRDEWHISTFVELAYEQGIPYSEVALFIASALIMDAYPPRMHRFDARMFFTNRYSLVCASSFTASKYTPSLLLDVQGLFEMLSGFITSSYSSAELRRWCQSRSSWLWIKVKCNNGCLGCLSGLPQHSLPCGHALCDDCVMINGKGLPGGEYYFLLSFCPICGTEMSVTVNLNSPTSGRRILCLDGGGIRGCAEIENLKLLQDLLNPIPIVDCFELGCGTSSGGIIILALFGKRWTIEHCGDMFRELSHKVFESEPRWISDEMHSSGLLEDTLQKTFGPNCQLFGLSSSSKFAVTACSIVDGAPFILANYNVDDVENHFKGIQHTVAEPSQVLWLTRPGYAHIRAADTSKETRVWTAARATSAAPVLYRSIEIGHLGLQDGGLKFNNPSRLAWWEARRLWPSCKIPDVLLSLGTGYVSAADNTYQTRYRNILFDGFLSRLIRSSLNKIDGQIMWDDFANGLDVSIKEKFVRLNPAVSSLASLNDPSSMDSLRQAVRSDLKGPSLRLEIVERLLATSFYLTLDELPKLQGGRYQVFASIRCKISYCLMLQCLQRLGIGEISYELDRHPLLSGETFEQGICPRCQRYRRSVHFTMKSLRDEFVVSMGCALFVSRKLGAFPQTLQWFIEEQGLERHFGTRNHDIPHRLNCGSCDSPRLYRRKHHIPLEAAIIRHKRHKTRKHNDQGTNDIGRNCMRSTEQNLTDSLSTFWRTRGD